jgi:hypothetical protein
VTLDTTSLLRNPERYFVALDRCKDRVGFSPSEGECWRGRRGSGGNAGQKRSSVSP